MVPARSKRPPIFSPTLNFPPAQSSPSKDPTRPSDADDVALMREIVGRNVDAFSRLYDRLAGPLFSLAWQILRQREEAQDVLQEVFMKIWNRAEAYDPARGAVFSWAVTMTRSKAIDRLRALRRRERLHENVEVESAPPSGTEPAGAASHHDETSAMRRMFLKIPAEQREALELAYFGGLTRTEIAEKTGEPLGTVKARIRRGLMRMRDLLAGKL